MNGIKTFARSNSTEAINAAFRTAQVSKVPEVDVITYSFLAANTPYTIPHALGKKPEFARWLGETSSNLYATAADKALWTDTTITVRCNGIATGLLHVEAR